MPVQLQGDRITFNDASFQTSAPKDTLANVRTVNGLTGAVTISGGESGNLLLTNGDSIIDLYPSSEPQIIEIMLGRGLLTNKTGDTGSTGCPQFKLQIGGASVETSGYSWVVERLNAVGGSTQAVGGNRTAPPWTDGFYLNWGGGTAATMALIPYTVRFILTNLGDNNWSCSLTGADYNPFIYHGGGTKMITGPLQVIRLTNTWADSGAAFALDPNATGKNFVFYSFTY